MRLKYVNTPSGGASGVYLLPLESEEAQSIGKLLHVMIYDYNAGALTVILNGNEMW